MGIFDNMFGGGGQPSQDQAQPDQAGLNDAQRQMLGFNTIGSIGAMLLAAGQKQMPADRAKYLAQLGNIPGQMQQQQTQMLQQQMLAQKAKAQQDILKMTSSPEFTKAFEGMNPQMQMLVQAAAKSGDIGAIAGLYEKTQPKSLGDGFVYDPQNKTVRNMWSGEVSPFGGGAATGTAGTNAPAEGTAQVTSPIPSDVQGQDRLAAIMKNNPAYGTQLQRILGGLEAYPAGRQGIPSGLLVQMKRDIGMIDPNFDFNDPAARTKTRMGFSGNGADAVAVANLNTALHHGGELFDLNKQRNATSIPVVNSAINAVMENVAGASDTAKTNAAFNSTAEKFAGESEAFLTKGNPTLAGRKALREPYSTDRAPEQVDASLKADAALMLDKFKPILDKWNKDLGPNSNVPPPSLNLESVQYLDKLGMLDKVKELKIPVSQDAAAYLAQKQQSAQQGGMDRAALEAEARRRGLIQ